MVLIQITEDLASVFSMHGTITGKYIFMQKLRISFDALHFIEEKNMAEVRKALLWKIRTKLDDLQLPGALFIHCIILWGNT